MSFATGTLVKARGREWVVLPGSDDALMQLRPLGGRDEEVTAILSSLETIEEASFNPPGVEDLGDSRSGRILRLAARLTSRGSTGPFRSFGRIAVEPRPYQLVPLLMALKLDPVRLLIADDVGIGKTIESGLIARELLDRGEIKRIAVLCPPPLAEQWQKELKDKFHIDAELVLASTARRLEQQCRAGESLFDRYPFTVVSLDYIKSDYRRDEFSRTCPELVIVDEAHTCTSSGNGRGRRQQRYELIRMLSEDKDRHLIFATATPHNGDVGAFSSLVGLLEPSLSDIALANADDTSPEDRRKLAKYMVQRRRADIRTFLEEDTPFPNRLERERAYSLSNPSKALFEKAFVWSQRSVSEANLNERDRRVRWWSVLALLRSLGSSPAAAAATLRNRTATAEAETRAEADLIGARMVLDLASDEQADSQDTIPGSLWDESPENRHHKALLELAREAEKITPQQDTKLKTVIEEVKQMVKEGFRPIVFCRFIPTAEYVAEHLKKALGKSAVVDSITGLLPPSDREQRIADLADAGHPVLVATDCLSEGINLQDYFDAVIHYDLSWNPTRHEQREGRVDRFGQNKQEIKILTIFCKDNRIDGLVLDVLIRKHNSIRNSLGVSIPVPMDSNTVMEALMEGLVLRGKDVRSESQVLEGFEDIMRPQIEKFHNEWDNASAREKQSRAVYAQRSIHPGEVKEELKAARESVGSREETEVFLRETLRAHGATVSQRGEIQEYQLTSLPSGLKETLGTGDTLALSFDYPVPENTTLITRTHPLTASLAGWVMDAALDRFGEARARRAGVYRSDQVKMRTTLILVRFRFDTRTKVFNSESSSLGEETRIIAFRGSPEENEWLNEAEALSLLNISTTGNILPQMAERQMERLNDSMPRIQNYLEKTAYERAEALKEANIRVRNASVRKGFRYEVRPHLPPDILGTYIYMPGMEGSS